MIKTDDKSNIELSKIEFPLENFIKAGYNTIAPRVSNKRYGYSHTIYYILSGELEIKVNGETYKCGENSIIHLSKEDEVYIYNPSKVKKASLYYLLFDLKAGVTMEDLGISRVVEDSSGELLALCKDIYKTHLSEGAAYKVKVFYEFSHLLYELITVKLKDSDSFDVNYKISKALQYIRMNYYKNISVEDLADISGYSVSHFRRLFVNTCGMSPQDYMLSYKIRKAKELLMEEKDKSVEEIAELLGMCNASYFCRIFKEKTGVTPYKYKHNTRPNHI